MTSTKKHGCDYYYYMDTLDMNESENRLARTNSLPRGGNNGGGHHYGEGAKALYLFFSLSLFYSLYFGFSCLSLPLSCADSVVKAFTNKFITPLYHIILDRKKHT